MARSKVYLRSQSGRVENFDELAKRLKKLGTSETMRFREVRNLLMKEAQPLVTEARKQAYKGVKEKGEGKSGFYNLYNSIGKWKNKGNEKAYVVVGLRDPRKKGAIYALGQLAGAGPGMSKRGRKVGLGKGQQSHPGYVKNGLGFISRYILQPKDFIGKAVDNTTVVEKAQKLMQRHIQKRITSVLQ